MPKLATPAFNVPLPRVTPLSLKVTFPVGVPVPGAAADTVAVNVTVEPVAEGFHEEARTVVVPA